MMSKLKSVTTMSGTMLFSATTLFSLGLIAGAALPATAVTIKNTCFNNDVTITVQDLGESDECKGRIEGLPQGGRVTTDFLNDDPSNDNPLFSEIDDWQLLGKINVDGDTDENIGTISVDPSEDPLDPKEGTWTLNQQFSSSDNFDFLVVLKSAQTSSVYRFKDIEEVKEVKEGTFNTRALDTPSPNPPGLSNISFFYTVGQPNSGK